MFAQLDHPEMLIMCVLMYRGAIKNAVNKFLIHIWHRGLDLLRKLFLILGFLKILAAL